MPSHSFLQMTQATVPPDSIATIPDAGNITLLTTTQIDARFTNPRNGLMATGTVLGLPVLMIRRAGAWHTVSLTLI